MSAIITVVEIPTTLKDILIETSKDTAANIIVTVGVYAVLAGVYVVAAKVYNARARRRAKKESLPTE